MKHISILVPEGAILGSIEGPRQVLTEANKYGLAQGGPALFEVQLVGLSETVRVAGGKYTVRTDAHPNDIDRTDLILIPALDGDLRQTVAANQGFVPWIVDQHRRGAEVGSLCVGAFLLASTGLLDGRPCATHWMAAREFRQSFPQVKLIEDRIITDEAGLYSSGGAFSYLNLILYLIEKYAGRPTAVFMAKAFQIEIDRHSQSPFIIFQGQKEHADETIRAVQQHIESNVMERHTVDELALQFGIGRRNLERRFKRATANSVVEYIQRVKIEAAKLQLESSRDNINEVMYGVGYADPKAFRQTFRKITGLSPTDYRQKFNRATVVSG
ncbi:GlxA family transcriptional regulator [Spirosoma utsteinense]|uniref:Transcriptional regulator GlxA family with amidase domain n=1 Tax=Spirosoma utsteinense TaxID=2585773 RepID=A0ABR6WDC8_9BACT|nr:helix-turn-helix domain-containing protein [Spirosoma utsteinense]MBC3784208.1 transcriptional regulator GlxA family with amidase domain [Spirosoma utsteinense]MBC3794005.1 transcriptional regulator GlxA family with amidase domain [Spirosoma utsteinense]